MTILIEQRLLRQFDWFHSNVSYLWNILIDLGYILVTQQKHPKKVTSRHDIYYVLRRCLLFR